jgi:hypothetical protein
MTILGQIQDDTVSRLQRAAALRRIEADCLFERNHLLAALYLYGYVAEITLGVAYFRMRGWATNDPILAKDLNRALNLARSKSSMMEKAHPIDGWGTVIDRGKGKFVSPRL